MKLKCKKCGTLISVPPDFKQSPDPRVECPQCQTTYRLRKRRPKVPPGEAAPTPSPSSFTAVPKAKAVDPQPSAPSAVAEGQDPHPPAPSAALREGGSQNPEEERGGQGPHPPAPSPASRERGSQNPEGTLSGGESPWAGALERKVASSEPTPPVSPPISPLTFSPGSDLDDDDDAPTQLLPPSSASNRPAPTPSSAAPSAVAAQASPAPSSGLHSTPAGGGMKLQAFQPETILAERYRIVRFLAHGGMGEVYEAEDLELKDRLALKTISPAAGATHDVATIDRFKREIALARTVTHPNVCRIFDLGQHTMVTPSGFSQRVNFLTMELLQGETLAARLRRRKRLSPNEALPLVQQMATALDAAHDAKVVHRDFKSENVFLVPVKDHFRAVVTDFGVARGSDGADSFAAQVTGTGIVGTPSYMAPEQVEGLTVTLAADIYAFGVVMYEMLSGHLPFSGPTPLSTAVKRLQEDPPSPRIHVPDIPEVWEQIILRCLARQPEDRFASAGEVAMALTGGLRPEFTTPTGSLSYPGPGSAAGWGTTPEPTDQGHFGSQIGSQVNVPTHVAPYPAGTTGSHPSAHPPGTQTPGTHSPTPSPTHAPSTGTLPGVPAPHPTAAPPTGTQPGGLAAETTGLDAGATMTAAPAAGGSIAAATSKPSDKRQSTLVAVLALVLLVSAGLYLFNRFKDQDRRVAPRRSVAVLGFKNLTGQSDADWLATALTEMLSTELGRSEALRAIPSDNAARVRREMGIDDVTTVEAEQLEKIRSLLSCDFVVVGSYTRLDDGDRGLRIDLRLRDAALGETVTTASRQGAQSDLFPMTNELGQEVRRALGIGDSGEDAFSGLPTDSEAARLYSEALEELRASHPGTARQLLQQAVSREPTNALLHSALSSAWGAEGYSARAAQSAERAFQLSSQLPQEDRLAVEGHFRELQGDWRAAGDIYTTLWDFFPDNLDYGLRLVAAENNARRPEMAMAAIDRLRLLPPPMSEDPRIDLAEATSAALMGDAERQLQSADNGLQRAEPLGATLLAAQAQIARAQALRRLGRLDQAEVAATTAESHYTSISQSSGTAMARTTLANVLADRGDFDGAAQRYRQAIETYRGVGDQASTATGLNNLALVLRKKGDLEAAEALYQEAVEIYTETDNKLALANTANNLGVLLVGQDHLAAALERFAAAGTVWEATGDRAMQAFGLNNVAAVAALQGRLWESKDLHEQALEIRQEIGHKTAEVTSLTNLADLLLDLGDLETSTERLDQARLLADEIGDRAAQADVLIRQAQLDLAGDELAAAKQAAEQAIELRRQLKQTRLIADGRLLLAKIHLAEGQHGEAQSIARELAAQYRREQRPGDSALALDVLARALAASDRHDDARNVIAEALILASDSERRAVGLQLEITSCLIRTAQDATPGTTMERLIELEAQLDAAGYGALRLEASLARGRLAAMTGRRAEARETFETLEAEASARGFSRLARLAAAEVGS